MYKSFEIKNFRCFREFKISNLERINLIVGKNNIGKTALLEALFIHSGAYNPILTLKINPLRGIEPMKLQQTPLTKTQTPWDTLFYNFNNLKAIELIGDIKTESKTINRRLTLKVVREREELAKIVLPIDLTQNKFGQDVLRSDFAQLLQFAYQEDGREGKIYLIIEPREGIKLTPVPPLPPFPGVFLPARVRTSVSNESEQFSELKAENKHEKILSTLKLIEPRLSNLEVLTVAEVPIIHGEIGLGRPLPLPLMGEGMARIASLLLSIGTYRGGIVLIDEIENGLHHLVLEKVWSAIATAAREFDVQIFATTHSLECIKAFNEAFSKGEIYDFKLYRLERNDDKIDTVDYDKETLDSAMGMDMEVR